MKDLLNQPVHLLLSWSLMTAKHSLEAVVKAFVSVCVETDGVRCKLWPDDML